MRKWYLNLKRANETIWMLSQEKEKLQDQLLSVTNKLLTATNSNVELISIVRKLQRENNTEILRKVGRN